MNASSPGESMSQLSAHLDRGWESMQQQRFTDAERSARHALAVDGRSPEAQYLLGAALQARGLLDEAKEAYAAALDANDALYEALLGMAEVVASESGDAAAALRWVEEAAMVAETEDERAECLVLRAELFHRQGDKAAAEGIVRGLVKGLTGAAKEAASDSERDRAVALLRLCVDLDAVDSGRALAKCVAASAGKDIEAMLACAAWAAHVGAAQEAAQWSLRAFDTDARSRGVAAPEAQARVLDDAVARSALLDRALKHLSGECAKLLEKAALVALAWPGAEMVVTGVDPRALVVVEGDLAAAQPKPERLFVYVGNLARVAPALDMHAETALAHAIEREVMAWRREKA